MLSKVAEIIPDVVQVGGSVRDIVMGREPKDFDFATPYDPDKVEELIRAAGLKAYTVGRRFGTIGCRIDGQDVEITTYRTEKYAEGSRKPTVSFTSDLYEDLSRRDFTMNAIALVPNATAPLDLYQGVQHIKDELIVAVGDPRERFKEDPLRMLRAARFAAQLDFRLDNRVYNAMAEMNDSILTVSKERWVGELNKLLMGENVHLGLSYLSSTCLLQNMIPEISLGYFWQEDVYEGSVDDRWVTLLKNIGFFERRSNHPLFKADCVRKIATHLKFSKSRTQYIIEHI